ncbi:MAG: hypothetical protein G5Z42_01695 [Caldisphaeraceae archaeon]|nr:hypothetical protein [Caldisphaeraceae archaeon]MEB3797519.1 hypothetical protein [Caldisphaeraceae archaeon]
MEQNKMKVYRFKFPLDKIYVSIIEKFDIDNATLSQVSKLNQPRSLIFSVNKGEDPCLLAFIYFYVMEDYDLEEARLSNASLRALLYLTGSRQVSEALEKAKRFDSIGVVSNGVEHFRKALSSIGFHENAFEEEVIDCNMDKMVKVTHFRLFRMRI